MKLTEYLKKSKIRMALIYFNVAMSIVLSVAAVAVDEQYGAAGLFSIYVMQVVCFINWIIAFVLIIWNVSVKLGKKKQSKIAKKPPFS